MNWGVLARQVQYQNRAFWRTPVAAFFSVILPLVMMVLFNALFDGETMTDNGPINLRNFYTAGLAAFAAVSSTYTNLANVIPIRRDEGVLKRWRGTPLSSSMYLAGILASAVITAVVGVVIMMTLGVLLYGVDVEVAKLPGAALTFFVGVASFAALGLAIASLIPSAEAAPAVANATILPLAFISDVFIPLDDAPRWLEILGDIFRSSTSCVHSRTRSTRWLMLQVLPGGRSACWFFGAQLALPLR